MVVFGRIAAGEQPLGQQRHGRKWYVTERCGILGIGGEKAITNTHILQQIIANS
jgi:hypothetical protein